MSGKHRTAGAPIVLEGYRTYEIGDRWQKPSRAEKWSDRRTRLPYREVGALSFQSQTFDLSMGDYGLLLAPHQSLVDLRQAHPGRSLRPAVIREHPSGYAEVGPLPIGQEMGRIVLSSETSDDGQYLRAASASEASDGSGVNGGADVWRAVLAELVGLTSARARLGFLLGDAQLILPEIGFDPIHAVPLTPDYREWARATEIPIF